MDDYKLPMISQEIYDEVERIVNRGKMCGSQKEVQKYIDELNWIRRDLPTRASFKIVEISSCLKQYCNIRSNKYEAGMQLNNQLGGLCMMIEHKSVSD